MIDETEMFTVENRTASRSYPEYINIDVTLKGEKDNYFIIIESGERKIVLSLDELELAISLLKTIRLPKTPETNPVRSPRRRGDDDGLISGAILGGIMF